MKTSNLTLSAVQHCQPSLTAMLAMSLLFMYANYLTCDRVDPGFKFNHYFTINTIGITSKYG